MIEALVALAVAASGVAAIGMLTNSSLRSEQHAEQHMAQISATREIIAGLPGRDALPFGRLSGVLDGQRWLLHSTPVAATTTVAGAAEWIPQGIALLVRSPSGSIIEIDTIRIRRQPKK